MKKFIAVNLMMGALFMAGCENIIAPAPGTPTPPAANSQTIPNDQASGEVNTLPKGDTKIMALIKDQKTSPTTTPAAPLYEEYTKAKYDSLKGKEPVALFFHAGWCHECRDIDKNLKEQLNNFPAGTKILKLDYDKETELKKEYQIRVQTSIVILDAAGKVSTTLVNPSTEALKAAISKTLS